jgi:hypothetical protein
LRKVQQALSTRREKVERDEGRRCLLRELGDSGFRRMQPQLERVEVEPGRGRDDDLPIDHAVRREPLEQGVVQLGEVAVQRPQVAALDVDVRCPPKDDGPEAVPLRLVQEGALRRDRLGQCCEHRRDGGRQRKIAGDIGHGRQYTLE